MRILAAALLALAFATSRWFQYRRDMPAANASFLTVWSLAAYAPLLLIVARNRRAMAYLFSSVIIDGLLCVSILASNQPSEAAFTTSNYLPALQALLVVPGVYLARIPSPRPRWYLAAFALYVAAGAFLIHMTSSSLVPPAIQSVIPTVTLTVVVCSIVTSIAGVFVILFRRA